jgi:hypothetical protein
MEDRKKKVIEYRVRNAERTMKEKLKSGEVTIAQIKKHLLESEETPREVKEKLRRGDITDADLRSELENMVIPIDQCRHTYFLTENGQIRSDDVEFEAKQKEEGTRSEREGGEEGASIPQGKGVTERKRKSGKEEDNAVDASEPRDIVSKLTQLSTLKKEVCHGFCNGEILSFTTFPSGISFGRRV